MSDDLNRQIFKEEAYDLLGELEEAVLELEQAPDDMDLINQIFRALHTIKGSGSMFGFEDIAEFTHEVETVFDMVRNGDLPVTPKLCSLSLKSRDHIRNMLDNSDDDEVVAPEAMEEILLGLKGFASGDSGHEEDGKEPEIVAEESAPAISAEFHKYQIILTAQDRKSVV